MENDEFDKIDIISQLQWRLGGQKNGGDIGLPKKMTYA
jgi:hypothetical protein